MHITFLHLDLGVGGAERLIVDAACSLKLRGHSVSVVTSHHDPSHCFEETLENKGLLGSDIYVDGDFLPRHACGRRFHLLFAVLRMMYVTWRFRTIQTDVLVIDQVSLAIPFARWCFPTNTPILFYLHFPDKLLVQNRNDLGLLRRIYRAWFDWMEEMTTCRADRILVNSQFTLEVVGEVFPSLQARHKCSVLYPCVDLSPQIPTCAVSPQFSSLMESLANRPFALSINRLERKKNLLLLIDACALDPALVLVITGGFDHRVEENVHYFQELQERVQNLSLSDRVLFHLNATQEEKQLLLQSCRVVAYSPSFEHFGIVPIEAGAAGKPCVACNNGGPKETILHKETGWLCESHPREFAQALVFFIQNEDIALKAGARAKRRVEEIFSRTRFGQELELVLADMVQQQPASPKNPLMRSSLVFFSLLFVLLLVFLTNIYPYEK